MSKREKDRGSQPNGVSSDEFEAWQRLNPSKSFNDFQFERREAILRGEIRHGTLGGNLYDGYGVSGKGFFRKLVKLGLKPDDTCVDYGCGTLRLGIHAIKYLKPGAYWGMDVVDCFLREGRKLVGDRLWKEKQPNLRLISAESVTEVARARPALLFSVHVLKHLHPDQLNEYFHNIIHIIDPRGQAIIVGKWSDSETIQYNTWSWAHAFSLIQNIVEAERGSMKVIREQRDVLPEVGKTASKGLLRVIHHSGSESWNHFNNPPTKR